MSDALYETYQRYGTNAERLAFTPDPPTGTGVQPIYIWRVNSGANVGNVYLYDTTWTLIATSGASSAVTSLTGDVTATGPGAAAATIANSAVTLAKIANASANSKLLGSGASGSGAPYSELTLGTNLSMSGTTLNAASGASSGLVLLEQHTASASASLDFTSCISSTYDDYQIEIVNLIPATDGVDLYFRVSTDGGATYISTNSYRYNGMVAGGGVTTGLANPASTILLSYNPAGIDSASNFGWNGTLYLRGPLNTSAYTAVLGHGHYMTNEATPTLAQYWPNGLYLATTAVNAFQVLFSSGNIASGTIRVYGLAK